MAAPSSASSCMSICSPIICSIIWGFFRPRFAVVQNFANMSPTLRRCPRPAREQDKRPFIQKDFAVRGNRATATGLFVGELTMSH